jgi:hypothetical protein
MTTTEDKHRDYLRNLAPQERTMLVLRDELCEGSWDEHVGDLLARLKKKPHLHELRETITADIEHIEKLRAYEKEHGIDLDEYFEDVPLFPPPQGDLKRGLFTSMNWKRQ